VLSEPYSWRNCTDLAELWIDDELIPREASRRREKQALTIGEKNEKNHEVFAEPDADGFTEETWI